MLKANLFINFYQDKNPARQTELNICVASNIYNPELDTINILVSNRDLVELLRFKEAIEQKFQEKINIIPFELRPTYNHYFKFTEQYPNDINIISNKDIIIDENSLKTLKTWDFKNYCLALTRWDFIDNNLDEKQAVFYNHADSQDTWIVKGSFKQLPEANFGLGVAGCDNVIAHKLNQVYTVINPSIEIKTYHYHITNIRNYTNRVGQAIERLQPPYYVIQPTMLPNE